MIVFTNENREVVYSVESEVKKTVSLLLPFSPKTKRFLSSFYDLQLDMIELSESYNDLKDIQDEDLNNLSDEDLKSIKEKSEAGIESAKITFDLMEELIFIFKLENEYENGVFSYTDIQNIFKLVIQQAQNQPPKNIEKKRVKRR
jgi:hypothetical protein